MAVCFFNNIFTVDANNILWLWNPCYKERIAGGLNLKESVLSDMTHTCKVRCSLNILFGHVYLFLEF